MSHLGRPAGAIARAAITVTVILHFPPHSLEGRSCGKGHVTCTGASPPLLEDTIDEHVFVLRVDPPESTFARLVFAAGNLLETLVQRKVVTDGILQEQKETPHITDNVKFSQQATYPGVNCV